MKTTALVALFVVLGIACASASCVRPATAQEGLERSSAVFSGKVIRMDQPTGEGNYTIRVTIDVLRVWKGSEAGTIVVETQTVEAPEDSSYDFRVGSEYLVYARERAGKLEVGTCSGTKPLSEAQGDLAWLGSDETCGMSCYALPLLAIAVAAAACLIYFKKIRSRK